jgi:hypothetical protein
MKRLEAQGPMGKGTEFNPTTNDQRQDDSQTIEHGRPTLTTED